MNIFVSVFVALVFGAAAIRIIKWLMGLIYRAAPFIVLWGAIVLVLYDVGYFDSFEKEVKEIHANITRTAEN